MGFVRRLEVKGFKSFGPRTVTINFEQGLNVVTGPNGSGKSNIADAILFALGENSPRTLRAAQGRLTGLIYDPKKETDSSGGHEEKPASCRVSVQFDNTDRKIPVDSDTVTVTRELRSDGDSSYYLNGKKAPKSAIADLLDVAGLSPGGLNIIPQNAATRVADLTPDEKRKMIEEVVGIARFDEKKAEAQKQLSQADTKLQIELARTGEMKGQLEKLEVQRNDLLRFNELESQVNWLRGVQTSRRIVEYREKLNSLRAIDEELHKKLDEVRRRKDEYESRIVSTEAEKNKFILEIVQGGGAGPTALRDDREAQKFKLDRMIAEVQSREAGMKQLEIEIIPSLRSIVSERRKQITAKNNTVEALAVNEAKLEAKRAGLRSQLEELRGAQETLRATTERKRKQSEKIAEKLSELAQSLSTIGLEASSLEATLGVEKKRLEELNLRVNSFSQILGRLDSNTNQLFELHAKAAQELGEIDASLSSIERRKDFVSDSIVAADRVFQKVERELAVETIRKQVTEDLTGDTEGQARMEKLCVEGGVRGYLGRLRQFVSYPQQYSAAVSAVLDRWLTAFVVEDMHSMTALIKAARGVGVKSFAVIPLSEVGDATPVEVDKSAGVIGPLSEVVKVEKRYQGLLNFVAGDTILVESEAIAYVLASEGFRTVTPKGEMFELKGRAFALGHHDILADILASIEDLESVGQIGGAVESLRSAIEKRKAQINSLDSETRSLSKDRVKRIASVAGFKAEAETVSRLSKRYRAMFRSVAAEQERQQKIVERLNSRVASLAAKRESIEKAVDSMKNAAREIEELNLDGMLIEIEAGRSALDMDMNTLSSKLAELHLSYTRERADLEQDMQPNFERMRKDLESAELRYEDDKGFLQGARKEVNDLARRVAELDAQLQRVLDSATNSRPVIDEFESRVRRLREERDAMERSSLSLEREILSNQQSVASHQEKVEQSLASLRFWGYSDVLETFEGSDYLLSQLELEYDELAKTVNKIAEREYFVVYDSYRNLSIRINELEQERTSIVKFIESVEADKKRVFTSAFETLNREFGTIFKILTTGEAWLEFEKPDDIFSGGIFMMASFRDKPAWESSSMSGGEKSVTAVSLILAIQRVNPHPFYLFDEIDQNLDQANSISLAAFLRERAKEAQLLVITLKDTMLSQSNVAYGVFSVGGISRMVRTKLEVQVKSG
jgi:chromosome segregation protein